MENPFAVIDQRLSSIEKSIRDLKKSEKKTPALADPFEDLKKQLNRLESRISEIASHCGIIEREILSKKVYKYQPNDDKPDMIG